MSSMVSRTACLLSTLRCFFLWSFYSRQNFPCVWASVFSMLPLQTVTFAAQLLTLHFPMLSLSSQHATMFSTPSRFLCKTACVLSKSHSFLFLPHHKRSVLSTTLWWWMLLSHYHLTLCLRDFSVHVKSGYTIEDGEQVPQEEAAKPI